MAGNSFKNNSVKTIQLSTFLLDNTMGGTLSEREQFLCICIMHEVSNSLSEEESRKENKNSERINAKPSKAVFALPHF